MNWTYFKDKWGNIFRASDDRADVENYNWDAHIWNRVFSSGAFLELAFSGDDHIEEITKEEAFTALL